MKKGLKKKLAFLLATIMVFAAPLTAMAENDTAATGTGSIFSYRYDTWVVPTTFKFAINPMALEITVNSGASATAVDSGAVITSASEIISHNYAILNKSNFDKKISVTLTVTPSGTVASSAAITNAAGVANAKKGDRVMNLKVYPAASAPTAVISGTTAVSITTGTTNEMISNALFTAATSDKAIDLVPGENNPFAFVTSKATYGFTSSGAIDIAYEHNDVKNQFELKTVGGVTGFTFGGDLNERADWTGVSHRIAISAVYKVEDADGDETQIGGTAGMIRSSRTSRSTISESNNSVGVTLPDGVTISSVVVNLANDGGTSTLTAGTNYTFVNGTLTMTPGSNITVWKNAGHPSVTINYSDNKSDTLTIQ